MVTVFRQAGLRFVIYKDDHEPAHVHVLGDGEAKINLVGIDGKPHLMWRVGLSKADVRRGLRIVAEHQHAFLTRWRDIHGR